MLAGIETSISKVMALRERERERETDNRAAVLLSNMIKGVVITGEDLETRIGDEITKSSSLIISVANRRLSCLSCEGKGLCSS